jgi:hypothetical protein
MNLDIHDLKILATSLVGTGITLLGIAFLRYRRLLKGSEQSSQTPSSITTDTHKDVSSTFLLAQLEKTNVYPILSAREIIDLTNTQALIDQIGKETEFNAESINSSVQPVIEKLAQYCQLLPASESHHHAYLGGLFEHLLEVILFALKARMGITLPVGAGAELISSSEHYWTYACLIGAVLHDIDKIKDMFIIELLADAQQIKAQSTYDPVTGSLFDLKIDYDFYRVVFNPERGYNKHKQQLAKQLFSVFVPQKALRWIGKQKDCLNALKLYLFGHEEANVKDTLANRDLLAQIIQTADQQSVQFNRSQPARARLKSATASPLSERLLQALFELLQSKQFSFNRTGAKAFYTQDQLAIVSKHLADGLRNWLRTQHNDHRIPEDNQIIFDELSAGKYCTVIDQGIKGYRAVHSVYIVINDQSQSWRQSLTCVLFDWRKLKNIFAEVLGIGAREIQDIEEFLNLYQHNQPIEIELTQQTESQSIIIGTNTIDTTSAAVTTTALGQLDTPLSKIQEGQESSTLFIAATTQQILQETPTATSEKESGHYFAPTTQESSEKQPVPVIKADAAKLLSQFKPLRNNPHSPQKKESGSNLSTHVSEQEIKNDSLLTHQSFDDATDQAHTHSPDPEEASIEVVSTYITGEDSVLRQTPQPQSLSDHSQESNLSSVIKPVSPPIQADFSVLDKLLKKSSHPEALKDFLHYVQGEIGQGRFNGSTYVLHFIEHLGQSCLFLVSPKIFQDYLRFNQAQLTEQGITLKTLQNALTSLKMNHPHKEDGNIIRVVINPNNVRKSNSKTTYHAQMRGFLLNTSLTHQLVHPIPASNPYLMLGYEHLHNSDETLEEQPKAASKNAVKLTVVKPVAMENKPEANPAAEKNIKKEHRRAKPKQEVGKLMSEVELSDDALMLDESQIPEEAFY